MVKTCSGGLNAWEGLEAGRAVELVLGPPVLRMLVETQDAWEEPKEEQLGAGPQAQAQQLQ